MHFATEANGTTAVRLLNCIKKVEGLKARVRRGDRSVVRIAPAAHRIRVCNDSCVCIDKCANALLANDSSVHGTTTKIIRLLLFVELVAAVRTLQVPILIRKKIVTVDLLQNLLVKLSSYLHFSSSDIAYLISVEI